MYRVLLLQELSRLSTIVLVLREVVVEVVVIVALAGDVYDVFGGFLSILEIGIDHWVFAWIKTGCSGRIPNRNTLLRTVWCLFDICNRLKILYALRFLFITTIAFVLWRVRRKNPLKPRSLLLLLLHLLLLFPRSGGRLLSCWFSSLRWRRSLRWLLFDEIPPLFEAVVVKEWRGAAAHERPCDLSTGIAQSPPFFDGDRWNWSRGLTEGHHITSRCVLRW